MSDQENELLWREYFYPGTEVLINYYDIKDYDKLKEVEATNSFERLVELQEKPIHLGCGKEHLNAIHRYIFEDVYPFAGKYRKVNMVKEKGAFLFIRNVSDIDQYLDDLFQEINDGLLHCNSRYDFCELLGRLYTGLIYCHPYREGNGRTTREFLREFSIEKSRELGLGELELDWRLVDRDQLNEFIEVAHLFPGQTASLFEEALVPIKNHLK